jgi:replicative DNA helicase
MARIIKTYRRLIFLKTNDLQPHNLEVEQSVLADCLLHTDNMDEYTGILKPEDFYRVAHQIIFSAMVDMANNNAPVKAETLAERLSQLGKLGEAGGGVYLAKLLDIPPAVDPGHYAGIIRGHSLKRSLIKAGNAIIKAAYRRDIDPEESLNKAQSLILNIGSGANGNSSASFSELSLDAGDRYESLQQNSCGTTGIPSGFPDLDRVSCGFQKSDLTILAARPAMGKTALAVNTALSAAKGGFPVGIFSLEMSREQLFNRAVSGESGVNLLKFSSGRFLADDWELITNAQARLYELPIHIDDSPGLHFAELRRRARKWKSQHNIKIIFIDYLQLMQGEKQNGRVEEVSSISRNLKGIAKELDIPVVCLSQLNRAVELRDNKRPRLSDLRDSGAIEQDADLVLFLFREEVYKKTSDNSGTAELAIAKHRNGPTGKIYLNWSKTTTKFYSRENR